MSSLGVQLKTMIDSSLILGSFIPQPETRESMGVGSGILFLLMLRSKSKVLVGRRPGYIDVTQNVYIVMEQATGGPNEVLFQVNSH